jgi:quinol-cytochrome oxidoreductase complex cytochrome b subunit
MLQAVPSKFGGLVVSAGAVVILFCVPWLDKGADSLLPWAGHRWLARVALGVLVVSFIVAGLAGRHHVQGPWLLAGRIATLGYYAYFLAFLPFYARLGRRGGGA